MNEAVRLVEEGVATPEDVDRAFKAGMGFRYASIGSSSITTGAAWTSSTRRVAT